MEASILPVFHIYGLKSRVFFKYRNIIIILLAVVEDLYTSIYKTTVGDKKREREKIKTSLKHQLGASSDPFLLSTVLNQAVILPHAKYLQAKKVCPKNHLCPSGQSRILVLYSSNMPSIFQDNSASLCDVVSTNLAWA